MELVLNNKNNKEFVDALGHSLNGVGKYLL